VGAALADDDMHVCLSSYVETQKARRDGHLRAARTAVEQCGRPECPGAIRNDCVRWQGELDEATPTVVLSAIGQDGRDVTSVSVQVDGTPLASRLDGRAVPMDPGAHVFRFVAPDGTSVEQRVLVAEGEHNRAIVGTFGPSTGGVRRPDVESSQLRPVPSSVWVVGGVGVAATAVAVTFWSLAVFAKPGLISELSCKPNCPQGSSDAMTVQANIGDAAGAVALLTLATAAYLYFSRPQVSPVAGFVVGSAAAWAFTF
jgi:hypothetical protein